MCGKSLLKCNQIGAAAEEQRFMTAAFVNCAIKVENKKLNLNSQTLPYSCICKNFNKKIK